MKLQTGSSAKKSYLFAETGRIIAERECVTGQKVLNLGIGDVSLPLTRGVAAELVRASAEMGDKTTFRGYAPTRGYDFLLEKIVRYYASLGVCVRQSDVFVTSGAKEALSDISALFARKNVVLLPEPSYPVYRSLGEVAQRKIVTLSANEENGFLPVPDDNVAADVVYLCSPNNPTGAAYDAPRLTQWVQYALKKRAVIVYDAAYERFLPYGNAPCTPRSSRAAACTATAKTAVSPVRSIYQIPGAEQCAVEICSLSKSSSFTGVRCGYVVVPSALRPNGVSLKELYEHRSAVSCNGVAYVVQRAAAFALGEEGIKQNDENIAYYMQNARILRERLTSFGLRVFGDYAPYVWCKCPQGYSDSDFFHLLLNEANVAVTPGGGFGESGKAYVRLSALQTRETIQKACDKIAETLLKFHL